MYLAFSSESLRPQISSPVPLGTTCSIIILYYVSHKAETHENRRFLSTGKEFAENVYAYVLNAPSRS